MGWQWVTARPDLIIIALLGAVYLSVRLKTQITERSDTVVPSGLYYTTTYFDDPPATARARKQQSRRFVGALLALIVLVPAALLGASYGLARVIVPQAMSHWYSGEVAERNDRELGEVVRAVVRGPRHGGSFESGRAGYSVSGDARFHARVSVDCAGCDEEALVDDVVEAVWRSDVSPLRVVEVRVSDVGPDPDSRIEFYDRVVHVFDERAELEERYGERPVESFPYNGSGASLVPFDW